MTTNLADSMRCPTCGARQTPSAECRRCHCDLTLVVALRRQERELHVEVLRQLRDNCDEAALATARRLWALAADETAARLLAVCCLRSGRFQEAFDVHGAVSQT